MGTSDNKAITIYDIAKEAGVSPATVSRVMTNSANVREEKRNRVQSIIEKYNFKPNALAKGLSDTSTKSIGVIAADVRNPFYAQLFVACEAAAQKAGYTVSLYNSFGITENEIEQLELFAHQKVDAIVQIGGRVDDTETDKKYKEAVKKLPANVPLVVTGRLSEDIESHSVEIDAASGMDLVMEHLLGLGHTRIALVGGRTDVRSTTEKILLYKKMLAAHDIEVIPDYIAGGSYSIESGYECMQKILKLPKLPTAVIAINDFTAAGVIRAIEDSGYRIPQDFSVASFDNTYISDVMIPKLTSVDYNYETFGQCLIDTAIAVSKGEDMPRHQTVQPTLISRESSGPSRA
ncbi:LacI family DNA-binding transcriptional regulator [Butyrivibrio sp. NC2002]|uniref:LacI family DNA-binding transcriptional regulator n=1 Tax=Butyrivibrio sp. NC2002 TaxID=1410610 RepID=UPI00055AAE77|nr:LacI family DNA-binding transcriptional regulator [Butyrivibrio sp. NC2002]